jgi:hypothetical protein
LIYQLPHQLLLTTFNLPEATSTAFLNDIEKLFHLLGPNQFGLIKTFDWSFQRRLLSQTLCVVSDAVG